ncbi:STAS domain-containing protein [Streptomyces sp. RKAG290]|uniref:STAS domain-containing protein n=1 Tax=Streptomyces sp. RKAG290 TaxID=2888348 RepID=UPI0020341926|nr:STAS domain-containing protein [Streptomyces sp. RKAG290]MCM2410768.1 STAS domain-containing protein [Streptomyces sp. RKAG290]
MSTSDHAPTQLPVVTAAGDLDASCLSPLETELQKVTATAPGVVLDVSGVTFGDSSFLNLLLRTHQSTDLRIAGVPPALKRLFHLVGVDTLLHIFPAVNDAQAQPLATRPHEQSPGITLP